MCLRNVSSRGNSSSGGNSSSFNVSSKCVFASSFTYPPWQKCVFEMCLRLRAEKCVYQCAHNEKTFRRWVSGKKPLILTIHQPGHISMQKGVIPLVHPRKINIALEKMIVAWKSTFLLAWPIIKGYVSLLKLFRESTLSPINMEVENHPKWKETHFWRDPFSTEPWLWEEGYLSRLSFRLRHLQLVGQQLQFHLTGDVENGGFTVA